MKVKMTRDDWYLYFESESGQEVEIPDDIVYELRRAMKKMEKVQDQVKDLCKKTLGY